MNQYYFMINRFCWCSNLDIYILQIWLLILIASIYLYPSRHKCAIWHNLLLNSPKVSLNFSCRQVGRVFFFILNKLWCTVICFNLLITKQLIWCKLCKAEHLHITDKLVGLNFKYCKPLYTCAEVHEGYLNHCIVFEASSALIIQ